MILLLGASGYFGRAFANELRRRGLSFIPLTRTAFDYTRFDYLFDYMRNMKPVFLINAAGYTGPLEQDGGEAAREKVMVANAMLPQMIARVCLMTRTPWGHVSSGSIYNGAKITENGMTRIEKDLGHPTVRELFERDPGSFAGFNELDEPNFSFRAPPANFLSGTKALAEEAIQNIGQSYIWRPRLAYSEQDSPSNFLWRFQREVNASDTIESMSHVQDCVRACLDLWKIGAPYGIYNVINPGAITTRQLAEMTQRILKTPRPLEHRAEADEPARAGGKLPQSHCVLDASKLLAAGVKMRNLPEALEDALNKTRSGTRAAQAPLSASPSSPPKNY
jgi:dTDP-4-dehydrorhamnose reductase